MVKIIDGKKIAEKIKTKIAKEIFKLEGLRPNLAIILVGEREDSKLYVSLKEREAKAVGVDTNLYCLTKDVKEEELFQVIDFLNNDETIDGILLQLPLPSGLDADKAIKKINPLKDVDGFHPDRPEYIVSPVLAAVKASLENTEINFKKKSACLMYNSEVFGGALKDFLIKLGVTDFLPIKESAKADLIITALGKPETIKNKDVKEGVVIIDISIVKVEGKVKGDVCLAEVKNKAAFITPVPGGIGPMTIAFLLKNVLDVFKIKQEKNKNLNDK